MTAQFVSIVIPVRNVEAIIGDCLESLKRLNYPSDRYEVIIADSLSTDKTCQIARSYGARVITTPIRSVCAGRNAGFEASVGELVAFTDADCVMTANWLKNSLKYFEDEQVAAVGGPNLAPTDDNYFSRAVDIQFAYSYYITKAAPVRVLAKVIESRSHGSNIIFRKEILSKVMPISEEIIEGEDVEMNCRITDLGYKLLYVPDVVVYHRRRSTPKRWLKQMYTYGIGRFLVRKRERTKKGMIHSIIGVGMPIIIIMLIVMLLIIPGFIIPLLITFIIFSMGLFFIALLDSSNLWVALWFPIVAYLSIIGWSSGFLRAALLGRIIPFKRSR